jgi:hypothetical protein
MADIYNDTSVFDIKEEVVITSIINELSDKSTKQDETRDNDQEQN